MNDSLFTILLLGGAGGALGSFAGLLYSRFGDPGESMRAGNSMGVGCLIGAAFGTLVGIFETLLGRL